MGEANCAILERAELGEDQRLAFRWRNTCGFPISLLWRSRGDDGDIVMGTVILAPHESTGDECWRCALPEWVEHRQDLKPSATQL
jgi:hypothetical protein